MVREATVRGKLNGTNKTDVSSLLHSKVFWSARNSCSVGELPGFPNTWVIRRSRLSNARERALVDERADTSCMKVSA